MLGRRYLRNLVLCSAALVACSGSAGSRITIVQDAGTCKPDSFTVAINAHMTFKLVNHSQEDATFAGALGITLAATVVPAGSVRQVDWHAPSRAGLVRFTCSYPDGAITVVTASVG